MAVTAQEAVPGKVYRRTRNEARGAYYMRPKTLDAKTYIRRLRKRVKKNGRDMFLLMQYRAEPERLLFRRYARGADFITGQRWEFSYYVLIPPEYRLRECKSKPGYK